jgi:hypothetical protein
MGKDTLICLDAGEVKLLNKVMASEKFYHSIYLSNNEKIGKMQIQIDATEAIADSYRKAYEHSQDQVTLLNNSYDNLKLEYDDLEKVYHWSVFKKKAWKTIAIAGIPISFAGGIFVTYKLLSH